MLRKGSQGPKQTSFLVLITVREFSVSFFLLLKPPTLSSLEIISIQQACLCFSDILLGTVAKLYGCVYECSLVHVLQTAASEKGISDLLETIYYTANHPTHSGRDFNISPCLSAMDLGEEEMHRESTTVTSLVNGSLRRPDREGGGGTNSSTRLCPLSLLRFSPLLCLGCAGAVSGVLDGGRKSQ